MIEFDNGSVRNFLSYGNVPVTFVFNKHNNTLIIGANGMGKSVLPDFLCFVLYGKAYRNITKGQLVNSINLKNCVCEINFRVDASVYRVVRGIKPNVFEIYKDNVLVDQEAATRDYQGYLENHILKINYKTFCQVVVMGSAAFTPFMQLSAGARRDVVEDVLDIAVFSLMNDILKKRIAETKSEANIIDVKLESAKRETISQQKVIKILKEAVDARVDEERDEIKRIIGLRDDTENEKAELEEQLEQLGEPEPFDIKLLQDNTRDMNVASSDVSRLERSIQNINNLTKCSVCLQDVGDGHKHTITSQYEVERNTAQENKEALEFAVRTLRGKQEVYDNHIAKARSIRDKISQLNSTIISHGREIERHQGIINDLQGNKGDIVAEQAKLKSLADDALKIIARKGELSEEKNLQDVALILLKDSGIKAALIKEYIPIINKKINRYLGIFGFDVNFQLDENFGETIHSRGRDEFSYNSFSEGEKRKIDIAILFAFRQVTEMKNSANCNLLILDEIVDSSLDANSREAFLEILTQEGGNNFVISHTAPSYDVFDAVMLVEKVGDFSQYSYLT
jgi:DNA repair exonuclease SbcCD ATPase subunit